LPISDRVVTKIWKTLALRKKKPLGQILPVENPFCINGATKPPPNFSKFFFVFPWPF
jgi:hypothetical protein